MLAWNRNNTTPESDLLALQRWYQDHLGQRLRCVEQQALDQVMPNLFGYHLLQIESALNEPLCGSSLVPHKVLLSRHTPHHFAGLQEMSFLRGHAETLPVASDSVDVVLLAHTLEFAGDPYQVLREIDRILVPEGHLVIQGFNPWSSWGAWHLICARWAGPPWNGRFRSAGRIREWLGVLGFDTCQSTSYFFRPPLQHNGLMRRLEIIERLGQRCWPFAGAGYILVAKKRVLTRTLIRRRWRPGQSLVGAGIVKPSTQTRFR